MAARRSSTHQAMNGIMIGADAMPKIRYFDALRLKQALNSAALDPDSVVGEPCRMLTPQELRDLKAIVDSLTLKPSECGHISWEWPMSRCPNCGSHDVVVSDTDEG